MKKTLAIILSAVMVLCLVPFSAFAAEVGTETRTCNCGAYEERAIAAKGHADADANYVCDTCGAELEQPEKSFFDKILDFFRSIIDWFKNLFS